MQLNEVQFESHVKTKSTEESEAPVSSVTKKPDARKAFYKPNDGLHDAMMTA